MKTKTCGDCKSFPGMGYYCPIIGRFCDPNNEKPCEFLEKPIGRIATNGDRIRQKSNVEFARDYVHYHSKFKVYVARLCPLNKQLWTTREEAEKANLEWLNAPAESEVSYE